MNQNIIVVENVVASGNSGPHRISILLDAKSHVEILRIIAHHKFGRMCRRDVIAGIGLHEVAEKSRRLPDGIIQLPVNHRSGFKTWNFYSSILSRIRRSWLLYI